MKEQILHLDPHDDFNSARDKIGWAQTSRVLLVWPPRGRVLARRLDLLLLYRHASRLGAHLALITADPVIHEHARDLGLPVFGSIEASRRSRWRTRPTRLAPARRQPRADPATLRAQPSRWRLPRLPAWLAWLLRGLVFALGVAGLAALALALVPGATITLTPATRPVQVSLEVIADPTIQTVDGTLVPARTVRVEVEADGRTATTGSRLVPSTPASGSVVFTSLDGVVTTIPQGTGVRTTGGQPVRFRTTRTVTIEPRLGATAEVEITAVDLGALGNVGAGLINAIDGPLGLQLAVTNPQPTRGGASAQRAAVTAADRQRLYDALLAQLEAEALTAIEAQLQPGEFLAYDSVRVADVVAETYNLAIGEQADTVELTLRIAVTGIAIAEAHALQVAQTALRAEVPAGEALLPGRDRYERDPQTLTDADGRVHFNVTARSAAVPLIERDVVRELVKGQPTDLALLRLGGLLPLSRTPRIAVSPDWFPRLPLMPFRIQVVVVESET